MEVPNGSTFENNPLSLMAPPHSAHSPNKRYPYATHIYIYMRGVCIGVVVGHCSGQLLG